MTLRGYEELVPVPRSRRAELGPYEGKYRRTPPVLAVEVQGELESEAALRDKAAWYRGHGVKVVWLVLPKERRVIVIADEAHDVRDGELPPCSVLPDLRVSLHELFVQLDG